MHFLRAGKRISGKARIKQAAGSHAGHAAGCCDQSIEQRTGMNMSEKQYYVTKEGLESLEAELDHLKTVRRKEVAEKIKVALSFGDLSENSEYDEAKNDQAMVEARIADLELMLKNSVMIDESELTDETVHIGSKIEVSIVSPDGQKSKREFKIVGSNEANPRKGKISDESAVGQALIGCASGQTVQVETPAGVAQYKVVTISR